MALNYPVFQISRVAGDGGEDYQGGGCHGEVFHIKRIHLYHQFHDPEVFTLAQVFRRCALRAKQPHGDIHVAAPHVVRRVDDRTAPRYPD